MPAQLVLPWLLAISLAACHSSTTPPAGLPPAAVPPPAASATVPASTGSTNIPTAPAQGSTLASAMSANAPAPSIINLNLLDIGVATAKDTLASLRQRYGADNIKDGDVPGAEGEELAGWILYPDDPKRRVYIYLDEAGVHPSLLRVLDPESQWNRSDGIHMGLSLTRLVELNGKPIQFSGFGWDYGGAIHDLHGGGLERKKIGLLTLCPPDFPDGKYPDNYPSGDAEFSSDDALVRRYPPVVCEFGVVLDANTNP
jgi:hypothetical protein